MNTHRLIKAADIRVGDTIQWTTLVCGISAKWRMTVSRIYVENTELFKVYSQQGGIRHFAVNDEFYLVDRAAPELPTKPGSLVYVEALKGEKCEPPILAFLNVSGYWTGEKLFPHGFGSCNPLEITEWSEATVAKATHNADAHSSTEPEPGLDHEFLPVAGHPDDDECTHRPDGTDETYCGEPVAAHQPKYDQGHGADWSDWDMLNPDEDPSCECGYNGTPEECEASRRHQPHERACPACLHNEVHWADRENPDPECFEPFEPITHQPTEPGSKP